MVKQEDYMDSLILEVIIGMCRQATRDYGEIVDHSWYDEKTVEAASARSDFADTILEHIEKYRTKTNA